MSQYILKSEIKKKDEKPKLHDLLKLPLFLEKDSRNLFLSIHMGFSFYFQQKSKSKCFADRHMQPTWNSS